MYYASCCPSTPATSRGCEIGYFDRKYQAAIANKREPNWSMVEVTKPGMYRGADDAGQIYAPLMYSISADRFHRDIVDTY